MKLTDALISALIRKGVFYEAKNVDTTFEIPTDAKTITIHFKAEQMSLRVDKED